MILFTDIDGTLLNDQNLISNKNLSALHKLKKTIKVAITGRNLLSATRVLPVKAPFDYLIFSNGAGIINWKTKNLIYDKNLPEYVTPQLIELLKKYGITFTVHRQIPDSHFYQYHIGSYIPEDFEARNRLYKPFVSPLAETAYSPASAIICMLTKNPEHFLKTKNLLTPFSNLISITRTTSPINHQNIWLEIYDRQVNKGKAAQKLCNFLGISYDETVAIGNDFNDLKLLEFVQYPFVVDNAPGELKQRFLTTVHHNCDAIAEVIEKLGLE